MSPSPSINDDHRPPQRTDSPEPLSEEDIIHMKARVADMGFVLGAKSRDDINSGSMTSREKELGGMVRIFPSRVVS